MSENKKNLKESSKKPSLPASTPFFRVAQFGCPHSDRDIFPSPGEVPRYPFQEGVQASIDAGKICDVYHVLGDWTGLQVVTEADKLDAIDRISSDINGGKEIVINNGRPFDIKSISGNHITEDPEEPGDNPFDLYQRAVQDTITTIFNSQPEPHPIVHDDYSNYLWESYYYVKGNNLFFFLGDRNDLNFPWGKNGTSVTGGHPAGAIKRTSIEFFVDTAIKHADKNVFLHTHQGLPNTVVGTFTNINAWRGHSNEPISVRDWKGTIGALLGDASNYFVDENDSIFELILTQWSRLALGCVNSHTHAPVHYDEKPILTGVQDPDPMAMPPAPSYQAPIAGPEEPSLYADPNNYDSQEDVLAANNSHFAQIGDTFILNAGNLTKYHGDSRIKNADAPMHPHGTIWEFAVGSSVLKSFKLMVETADVNDPIGTGTMEVPAGLYNGYQMNYPLKHPYNPSPVIEPFLAPNPVAIGSGSVTTDGDMVTVKFKHKLINNRAADGFAIVSKANSVVTFQAEDGKTNIPTYRVKQNGFEVPGEILRFQGTAELVGNYLQCSFESTDHYFRMFAINSGNGSVLYSNGTSFTSF